VAARLQAGQAAIAAQDYKSAAKEFSAALALDPANPLAHYYLGVIALVTDDAAAGLRYFSALPSDPRALVGKLDCELRLGRMEDARATAARIEQLIGNHAAVSAPARALLAKAASLLGTAEEKAGNPGAAVHALGNAARLAPENQEYRIDYAAVLSDSGDLDASIAAFRAAAADFPKSARVRLGLGSALYLAGRHDEAARALLEAARIEPGPRAFDLLGKAYESAGDLQLQILAAFRRYLADRPRDAAAFAHYGAILYTSGAGISGARKALDTALNIDPGLAAAHLQYGILEQSEGNTTAALQHLRRAAELEPVNAAVHYRLATVYSKLGREEESRRELEQFRRLKAQEKVSVAP
jgi:tetratricopeptide (TPR) repeat protein